MSLIRNASRRCAGFCIDATKRAICSRQKRARQRRSIDWLVGRGAEQSDIASQLGELAGDSGIGQCEIRRRIPAIGVELDLAFVGSFEPPRPVASKLYISHQGTIVDALFARTMLRRWSHPAPELLDQAIGNLVRWRMRQEAANTARALSARAESVADRIRSGVERGD